MRTLFAGFLLPSSGEREKEETDKEQEKGEVQAEIQVQGMGLLFVLSSQGGGERPIIDRFGRKGTRMGRLLLQDRMGQVVQSVVEFGDLFLNGRDPLLDQAGELQLRRFRGRVCSHLEKVGCNVDLGEGICEPLQDGFDVLHLVEAFPCSDVAPTRFSN